MKNISLKIFDRHALPGNDPVREWKILLSAFAFLALCSFAFGGYLFWMVGNGDAAPATTASIPPGEVLDAKAVSSDISSYESAPARTQNLVSGGQLFVDPSR